MPTFILTYAGHGQKHLIQRFDPATDRKGLVPVLTNRNDSAKHVFPGLTLALLALRDS